MKPATCRHLLGTEDEHHGKVKNIPRLLDSHPTAATGRARPIYPGGHGDRRADLGRLQQQSLQGDGLPAAHAADRGGILQLVHLRSADLSRWSAGGRVQRPLHQGARDLQDLAGEPRPLLRHAPLHDRHQSLQRCGPRRGRASQVSAPARARKTPRALHQAGDGRAHLCGKSRQGRPFRNRSGIRAVARCCGTTMPRIRP